MISHNYMIEKTLSICLLMPRSPCDPFIKLPANRTSQIYIEHDISVPLKSGQININQTIPEKGKN